MTSSPTSQSSCSDWLYDLLRRPTSSTGFVPVLDGMRCIAIVSVLLFHISGLMPQSDTAGHSLLRMGNIGVQLFFAISGFILAVPFFSAHRRERPMSIRQYFRRRLIRLEPPYILNLAVLVALGWTTSTDNDLAHFLATLFYVHGWVYDKFSTINFVTWSLEVEVRFYIIMPWLAWGLLRMSPPARRAMLGLGWMPFAAWQHVKYGFQFPHGLYFLDQVQFFAAGMLVADVFVHDWNEDLGKGSWRSDIVGLVGWVTIPLAMHLALPYARYTIPFSLLAAFAGTMRGSFLRIPLENRWVTVVGGMCYTIYLYHWWLMQLALFLMGGFVYESFYANLFLVVPIVLLATIFSSALLYLATEKPFMILSRRWTQHPQVR